MAMLKTVMSKGWQRQCFALDTAPQLAQGELAHNTVQHSLSWFLGFLVSWFLARLGSIGFCFVCIRLFFIQTHCVVSP